LDGAASHCGTPLPASRSSAVQSFGDEISAVGQTVRQYSLWLVSPEWCCHPPFRAPLIAIFELPPLCKSVTIW
jgi:hypothetical protein